MRHYVQFYGCRKTNIVYINVRVLKGQSKMDNPEKLAIKNRQSKETGNMGTQDDKTKKKKKKKEIILNYIPRR